MFNNLSLQNCILRDKTYKLFEITSQAKRSLKSLRDKSLKKKNGSDQILCLSETIVVVFDFFPEDTIQGP